MWNYLDGEHLMADLKIIPLWEGAKSEYRGTMREIGLTNDLIKGMT